MMKEQLTDEMLEMAAGGSSLDTANVGNTYKVAWHFGPTISGRFIGKLTAVSTSYSFQVIRVLEGKTPTSQLLRNQIDSIDLYGVG